MECSDHLHNIVVFEMDLGELLEKVLYILRTHLPPPKILFFRFLM